MKRLKSFLIQTSVVTLAGCTGVVAPVDPSVYKVSSISFNDATVSNSTIFVDLDAVVKCGSGVEANYFFQYSLDASFANCANEEADLSGNGHMSAKAEILEYGAKHYVKAYLSSGKNKLESDVKSFDALGFDEYVKVGQPVCSLNSSNILSLYSDLTIAEGITIDNAGFELSLSQSPFEPFLTKNCYKGSVKLSDEINNLDPGKKVYVRSYASEGKHSAFSQIVELNTNVLLPTISVPVVNKATSSSANVSGAVLSDGGANITERGVVLSKTELFDQLSIIKGVCSTTGVGEYSVSIANLEPGTTYYVKAYAVNKVGTAYSTAVSFKTPITSASVSTSAVSDITSTSATSGGTILSNGGATVSAKGVVWGTAHNPTIESASKTVDGSGDSQFVSKITGLSRSTTYYVRAYATTVAGTVYGNEVSFSTDKTIPSVKTTDVTSIYETTASSGGEVTDDGGAVVTARGVVWSTVGNPTVALSTKTTNGSGTGKFSSSISGLSPGTKYYVRAYATNSIGTAYGQQVSFTAAVASPTVSTNSVSSITSTSVTCGGTVTASGGAEVTNRGVVWSTSSAPTVSLSTKTSDGTGTGSFTSSVTGLQPATTYYIRAYATNSSGTSYGEERSFTTLCSVPVVVALSTGTVTTRTAICNAEVTNDGGSTVTSRGFVWSTSQNPTLATGYSIANGSGKGSFTCTLPSLTPSTKYYVRAYAVNSTGTSYSDEFTVITKTEGASEGVGDSEYEW